MHPKKKGGKKIKHLEEAAEQEGLVPFHAPADAAPLELVAVDLPASLHHRNASVRALHPGRNHLPARWQIPASLSRPRARCHGRGPARRVSACTHTGVSPTWHAHAEKGSV